LRALLLFLVSLSTLCAPTTKEVFKTNDIIWGFDFISKDRIIMSLKGGKIVEYDLKSKKSHSVDIPDVKVTGQGGLLDIRYFEVKGTPYLYYTYAKEVGDTVVTALARSKYSSFKTSGHKVLFTSKIHSSTGRHFGSRIERVGEDLFMSIGDRGERKYAQDLNYHNGKILRLTLEGKAAAKNPFASTKNALPEIWSYGHRNPQGLYYDESSKALYSCEFGPRGGDELNLIEEKKNYGWPVITYGKEYWGPSIGDEAKEGMEQPLTHWTPSISPSGMTKYTGDKNSKWKGSFFLATLGDTHLHRVEIDKKKVVKEERLLDSLGERIRNVRTGLDGELYISTDSGKILTVHQ